VELGLGELGLESFVFESGKVGTWLGIGLGPILYDGSGNGAS
jgi:hypothetical protein